MNYTVIKKLVALSLIQAPYLSASLTTQDAKNNDDNLNDLATEYNSILNGEIETIDLWYLIKMLNNPSNTSPLAKQAAEQKEVIATEVNKAIKFIKLQPSLVSNQSTQKKRNILIYVAATDNTKQAE